MFFQSSLLVLAVIQVIIPGYQTNPTEAPIEDGPLCSILREDHCQRTAVKSECPMKCQSKNCERPWISVDNHCIQVVYQGTPSVRSWSSARVYCNVLANNGTGDARGDLAILNNIQIQNRVYQAIESSPQYPRGNYWIGGSDLYDGKNWYWTDGSKITDYPVQYHAAECLYLPVPTPSNGTNTDSPSLFRNVGCGAHLHFICEKHEFK